jgi:hypothetical protein
MHRPIYDIYQRCFFFFSKVQKLQIEFQMLTVYQASSQSDVAYYLHPLYKDSIDL